jgi:hypothetical protein
MVRVFYIKLGIKALGEGDLYEAENQVNSDYDRYDGRSGRSGFNYLIDPGQQNAN